MENVELTILNVLSKKDITDKYAQIMKVWGFRNDEQEKMYEVTMTTSCFGINRICKEVWSESEMKRNIEQGFYKK